MSVPPKISGISDRAQAILVILASVLISIGSIQVSLGVMQNTPTGTYVGIAIVVAGALGLGIKEGVGALTKQP